MKKLCIALAFILTFALAFPVVATEWVPVGTPLFIEGPETAETGATIQLLIRANPACGADSFSGRPVTEGLQFVSAQGSMSSEDSMIILGSLGATEVTYTYLVTAKPTEHIRFTLANADVSNGIDFVSCAVPTWALTVDSVADEPVTNEPASGDAPSKVPGFAPSVTPLHILGPGWGSTQGDTIQITVTLDPSSSVQAASASVFARGLKFHSVTGDLSSEDTLMLTAPDGMQATYTYEVTANAGEQMSFCLNNTVVCNGVSDARIEPLTWTQSARFVQTLDESTIPPSIATPSSSTVKEPNPTASSPPKPTAQPTQAPIPSTTVSQQPRPTATFVRIPVDLQELELVAGSPLRITSNAAVSTIVGFEATSADIGTSCRTFKAQFLLPSDMSVQVRSRTGGILDDDAYINTGLLAVFKRKGTENAAAQIIVMGDVNGTGLMSLRQMVRIAQAYKGNSPLHGIYLDAGDFNETGRIDLSDVVTCAKMYRCATVAD